MMGIESSSPYTLCVFENFHSKMFKRKIAKGNSPKPRHGKWPQWLPTKNSDSLTEDGNKKTSASSNSPKEDCFYKVPSSMKRN